ncbi:DUF3164 family protein [Comamonas terrigena]|uniref:DUF3164 family protein n=1 Tax=Comamonas terrigena TaxID=32013 RepID=UPI00244981EA|nr:DUF3164 family protein [Comamonas terrigena]MDH0050266.1 DUF3164 family protein [Comamonas terrigena]MDH0512639.1 DUF3164 family protein [Comamonas terrigena]MDH1092874.1 DUF3164 family protein [Comamonas terrigena]MDH1502692.1 DUF3164 family protein [Comamonas terrigena]
MNQQNIPESIPAGYWENAKGNLVPESKVKAIDKLRDQLVKDLCARAEVKSADIGKFKLGTMADVHAFIDASVEQYGVKAGGKKGNATLMSFDGKKKVVLQMQDRITFGEQLQAAKALIDQCVTRWAANADDNIKVLITDAFQVDKEGLINTGRVLGLLRLEIDDPDWKMAMKAIADSRQVADTKAYIRFYQRSDTSGDWKPISLDMAAV